MIPTTKVKFPTQEEDDEVMSSKVVFQVDVERQDNKKRKTVRVVEAGFTSS